MGRWLAAAAATLGALLGLATFALSGNGESAAVDAGRIVEHTRTAYFDGGIQVRVHAWLDSQADPEAVMERLLPGSSPESGHVDAAYVTEGRWAASDIPVVVHYNDAHDPPGIDGAAGMRWAVATWNAVPDQSFRFSEGERTTIDTPLVCHHTLSDGINTIRFNAPLGENVLGITCIILWEGPGAVRITEFDIHFDSFTHWSTDGEPGFAEYDFYSVMLHELGHALGLGHTTVPNAVMQPYLFAGEVVRALTSDDLAGLRALYGTGATATPTATATSTPTPAPSPTSTPVATRPPPSPSNLPYQVFAIQVTGGATQAP